jgi:hypothetical protein
MIYTFQKDHIKSKEKIVIPAPIVNDDVVKVVSPFTGKVMNFIYNREETSQQYEWAEGWDGEQDLRCYDSEEGDIRLEVVQTPYCDPIENFGLTYHNEMPAYAKQ